MLVSEGKAVIDVVTGAKISKDLPVFYNPVMKMNRDMSVILLLALRKKKMQMADLLAASGVRSIRFIKELPKGMVSSIALNDFSEGSIASIRKNLALSGLDKDKKVILSCNDANIFLLESKGFDYIDIDPFGSPVPYLDASLARLARGGILAVTATDTAALAGTSPAACMRRYGSKPLRNEFMHETAIRILVKKVQEAGASHEKALLPIFSYAYEHYYRVFFACEKGRQKADAVMKGFGFVLYCRDCMHREASSTIFNKPGCRHCGAEMDYAGPLWLGSLWDKGLAGGMARQRQAEEHSGFLSFIRQEAGLDIPFYYDVSLICKKSRAGRVPKIGQIIDWLAKAGHPASRTHFSGQGIRTDASVSELIEAIRRTS